MTRPFAAVLAIAALAASACNTRPAEVAPPAETPAPVAAAGYTPVVSLNEIMV